MTLKRRSGSSNVPGAIIPKRFKIDENCQWTANRKRGNGLSNDTIVVDPGVTDDLETKVMSPNVECAITRKRFTIDE